MGHAWRQVWLVVLVDPRYVRPDDHFLSPWTGPDDAKQPSRPPHHTDGRLLLKQLARAEMIAFLKFAPFYFKHVSTALFHKVP